MLHYLVLIVLILGGLILGVLLSFWILFEVLIATDNLTAATCAALLTFICVLLAVALLLYRSCFDLEMILGSLRLRSALTESFGTGL